MKMKIRRGKIKDVEEVFSIGERISELKFSRKAFHDKDEIEEWVKKPKDNLLLVSEVDGKIAGFIYAKIIDRHWCLLDNLAVLDKYRAHGMGTKLVEELYKILRKNKIDYIQILEEIHHKRTRKFWRDKGFREEKVFIWADKFLR
jgi:N-acetylglutamate synthase-like GNAT family acetyltransferase